VIDSDVVARLSLRDNYPGKFPRKVWATACLVVAGTGLVKAISISSVELSNVDFVVVVVMVSVSLLKLKLSAT